MARRKLDEHTGRRNIRSNELRQQPSRLGVSITVRKPVSTRFHYFRVVLERNRDGSIDQLHNHRHGTERLQWNSDSDRHGSTRIELRGHHAKSTDGLGNGDHIV